jgi:hypothetical protein
MDEGMDGPADTDRAGTGRTCPVEGGNRNSNDGPRAPRHTQADPQHVHREFHLRDVAPPTRKCEPKDRCVAFMVDPPGCSLWPD